MNRHEYKSILLLSALVSIMMACRRDKPIDITSPAYHLQESEKLTVPAAIDLPANSKGHTRIATFYAAGVQRYKAQVKPNSNPVTYEWVFVAPGAYLYDISNKKVGTHGAGPFWQLTANDSIFAQQFSPAKTAASPDGMSIDWLLLMTKSGKTPTGLFADVSYIHRIATKGGKAPAALPVSATETVDVPYTAVYRFTKNNQ